jgi:hypothetical protein
MREVFLKPNIEFTFDNKYNLLKLLRSILSFIKNLIIDIILLEYGGNMVDFTDELLNIVNGILMMNRELKRKFVE